MFFSAYNTKVEKESMKKVLSLPLLEIFESPGSQFPHDELPEMKNMTKLNILFDNADPHFTAFSEAVRKMSYLESLTINYGDVKESELLQLVCGVVEAATSLGKDVVLEDIDDYEPEDEDEKDLTRRLKIMKTNDHKEADKILKLSFFEYSYDVDTLFEGVATFVRNKLYSYNAVELK